MSARLEPWYIAQQGERSGTDGHFQARPNAGVYVAIELSEGTYKTFDLLAAEMETQLDAASVANGWGIAFGHSTGTDSITITGDANFDLMWMDTELAGVLGFSSIQYLNYPSLTSDTTPSGRITLTNPVDLAWGDLVNFRHAENQTGARGGTSFSRRPTQRMAFQSITNSEEAHFVLVLQRLLAGYPARIWMDHTAAGAFAWNTTDWLKGRDLAVIDPSFAHNLAQWVARTHTLYRNLTIDFAEVT